jgi:predicted phage tail protein
MGKGASAHTPNIADDTLKSTANAYMLFGLCEGPIEGFPDGNPRAYIKLNGTPLVSKDDDGNDVENFKNVQTDYRNGRPDQSYIPNFFTDSADISNDIGAAGVQIKKSAPITVTIDKPDAEAIMIRFAVHGLYEQITEGDKAGDVKGSSVELKVELQSALDPENTADLGGKWVDVSRWLPVKKTGKASSQYEWSARLALTGKAPWRIRVSRITEDTTKQTLVNDTYLQGISVIMNKKLRYPGVALCAIKLDATQFSSIPTVSFHIKGQIIQVPSNYDPEKRKYNGAWDGTFKPAYSNNPAWCFYDLLTDKRYGLGDWIEPHMVDKWGLYEIARYCDQDVPSGKFDPDTNEPLMEPRFTLNCYIQTQEEALKVVQMLASAFHSMIYWASGAVFAVQDKPEDPSYLFTPANVKDGQFIYSSTARRARHNAVVTHWNNPENSYKLEPELFELEEEIVGGGGFRFPTERTAFGCTSRGQAMRDAKWALYTDNCQTEMVSFGVGLSGMELRPGDIIAIMDPYRFGKSWGGRIKGRSGNIIFLDREVTLAGGVGHNLIISDIKGIVAESKARVPDDTYGKAGGTTDKLILDHAIEAPENAVWMLAAESAVPDLWRVVTVTMDGDGAYSVTAICYDPQKFDKVERGIVLQDRREWTGLENFKAPLTPPQGLILSEGLYKDKEDLKVWVQAQWVSGNDSSVAFLPSYRIDEGNWTDLPATTLCAVEIKPVEAPCRLDFAVIARNLDGKLTPPAEASIDVLGKTAPPKDVTGFRVRKSSVEDVIFDWDANNELDFSFYEIREGSAWGPDDYDFDDPDSNEPRRLVTDLTANTHMTSLGVTKLMRFWIKACDTSGNWSINPASVVLDIYDPADPDYMTVEEKTQFAIQWNTTLEEYKYFNGTANQNGLQNSTEYKAYNAAILAVQAFLAHQDRQNPLPWNDLNDGTYLGAGGKVELTRLLQAIKPAQIKLQSVISIAGMSSKIASGATEAMINSKFLDEYMQIKWEKLEVAYKTIYAQQMYIANFDNLIPNPNSEQPTPSGGWLRGDWPGVGSPVGQLEGRGVYDGSDSYAGSRCRRVPGGQTLTVTDIIPCGKGDRFTFRAMARGSARISICFDGVESSFATQAPSDNAYHKLECFTQEAPEKTTSVTFHIAATGNSNTYAYFDDLYARNMVGGSLIVDGSIDASKLAAQLAILGTVESKNYKPGTSEAPPIGFKLAGVPFSAKFLDEYSEKENDSDDPLDPSRVQAEFGVNVSIGGHKAATLAIKDDIDRLQAQIQELNNRLSGLTKESSADGAKGCITYPNGMMMQWVRTGSWSGDGTQDFKWHKPFPNACMFATVSTTVMSRSDVTKTWHQFAPLSDNSTAAYNQTGFALVRRATETSPGMNNTAYAIVVAWGC